MNNKRGSVRNVNRNNFVPTTCRKREVDLNRAAGMNESIETVPEFVQKKEINRPTIEAAALRLAIGQYRIEILQMMWTIKNIL